jgi:pimeloyl-ACP methyl ester carboxylesterase
VAPVARRALATAGIGILFLVLIGATYQGVATALERRQFPHPGRLIDVGGRQLHMQCIGAGAPTVVLEAPATTMSAVWARVQSSVATMTRTCSYDRAGLGWSEAGETPFAPETAAPQLHALLMTAGERGPFVIAGAELGAALARLFAARYPDDTAGLILVNVPGATPATTAATPSARFLRIAPWLARTGVLRLARTWSSVVSGLPQPAAGELRSFLNRPDHLSRASGELSRWDDAVVLSEAAPLPRDLPVVQVEVEATNRIDLLANERNARDVREAIVRAVGRARKVGNTTVPTVVP